MTTFYLPPNRRNSLLAALAMEDYHRIERHLEPIHLAPGMVLLEVGQEVNFVYFPLEAVISLTVTMRDGATAEAATVGREGMDGFIVALGDRRALIRGVVQVGGAAVRLAFPRLEAAIVANPAVRELFLRYIQALMGQVMQSTACNALHQAEARLCRWLLLFHDQVGRDGLPITHEFLAMMLGVQRTTVTLIARTLQEAGLIRYRRGLVEILDRAGLEEAACECYAVIRGFYDRVLPGAFDRPCVG